MRIIFMIPRLTYSGAPKMMAWVANQMAKRGYDVQFVTFFSNEQTRKLHENVRFHSLNITQSSIRFIRNTTGMLKTLYRLDHYVKKQKPDVLVSFLDSVGYMYLPIGKKRCKMIVSERVDPYAYKGRKAKVRFKLMGYADKTVFQTQGARDFFKDKGNIYENSTVIPNPVVLSEPVAAMQQDIPTYEKRDNRIVTVGRLSLNQKRQDVLLQAFDIVHKLHPELELVIYGDGQDKDKIQTMIDDMGLSHSVTLAGRIAQVEREIVNARAFVLTSDFEGIPNALIEALSVGVPSVSTDCSPGGAALLVKNGENGYLVPRGDAKAVAEHLCKIIDSQDISERFSENGPKIVEEFSEEKIADMWEHYFLAI